MKRVPIILEAVVQDLWFGARMLRRTPAFTAIAVLTLALGIGANTAVFSLLYGLAFRSLPVPHPEQLVRFGAHYSDEAFTGLSLPMFEELARDQKVFSNVFAWAGDGVYNVEIDGAMSRADVWPVSESFQTQLGATPAIGRLIATQDVDLHATNAALVAVLDYGYWQRRFGGSPRVLGTRIRIEGISFTVIGVTQKGFGGISAEAPPEITVPLTADPLLDGHSDIQTRLQRPDALWLEAAGRLGHGIRLQMAQAQLAAVWPSIRDALLPPGRSPAERSRFLALQLNVESGARGSSFLRDRFTQPLYFLLAIAGLVLIVACVNLAVLTLARAASRNREMSVRIALGASRRRLLGLMLTESLMLSLSGMLGGLAFASWGSEALSNLIVSELYIVPAAVHVTPDLRILGFATGAALLTGLLFGLAPAWRATREDPHSALRGSPRVIGGETGKLGRILVVTQIALSVALLAGAGLFVRTLHRLRAVDPGFRTSGVLDVRLFAKPGGYKDLDYVAYYKQLADRVSGLPDVHSAAIVHMQPGGSNSWTEDIRPKDASVQSQRVDVDMVMPGAFRTMGIGLVGGRDFSWQDDEHAPHVAIVSRSFAERFLPGKNPIGQSIEITSRPTWQSARVIGVAADATLYDLRKTAPPTVYLPPMQYGADWSGWGEILIQTDMSASAMTSAIRGVVESMGHEYVFRVETISTGIERSLLRERVTALLSAFFGGLALLLVAIGLFGLMAYLVSRRTREIGIRMALGAPRELVRASILRETLMLAGLGIAIGLPVVLASSRLIAHLLYGISPTDPPTLVMISALLALVATLAGWLPARRATNVDPMIALRNE